MEEKHSRREFLKESILSLFETAKEFSSPFLDEEIEKWKNVQNQWQQRKEISFQEPSNYTSATIRLIEGKSYLVIREKNRYVLVSPKCRNCGNLLSVRTATDDVLCLPCNEVIPLQQITNQEDVTYIKKEDGNWYLYEGKKEGQ